MHMANALVAPMVADAIYVSSGTALAYSIKKVQLESTFC